MQYYDKILIHMSCKVDVRFENICFFYFIILFLSCFTYRYILRYTSVNILNSLYSNYFDRVLTF